MYSLSQRASTVGTFALSTLGFIVAFLAVTSLLFPIPPNPPVKVDLRFNSIDRFLRYNHRIGNIDGAVISMDIDADVSGLFNWNVKQVFCYVTASYKTPKNDRNELVLWDKIVQSKEEGVFTLKKVVDKYPIEDMFNDLRNKDVVLKFHWDVIPWGGLLSRGAKGESSFTLPSRYIQA